MPASLQSDREGPRREPLATAPVVEGRAAYEQWRAESLIAQAFEASSDADSFRSRVDYRGLGSVVALDYEMSASHYLRTAGRARRDGLDMIWVQLSRTGGFAGSSPGRSTAVGPRAGALCDFSVPVEQQSVASSGRALLIPRAAFGAVDPRELHGAPVSGGRYQLLSDYVGWLCANAGRADGREADALAIGRVTVACFAATTALTADIARELGPVALRRARAFIAGRLHERELGTDAIARAAGVSRATLYRLCAPLGGVSELVWTMRLEGVRAALSDPGRAGGIAHIAEGFGFTSSQHFSRRFRQTYGFSPRNLRPF